MPVVAIVNQTHGKRRRDFDHNENRLHHATIQANIEPSTIATIRKQNMPDNAVNAVNRGVYISDNLPFLQSSTTSASTSSASTRPSPRTRPSDARTTSPQTR